jgi:hypothetical protein
MRELGPYPVDPARTMTGMEGESGHFHVICPFKPG